jgi:hypothetical protein
VEQEEEDVDAEYVTPIFAPSIRSLVMLTPPMAPKRKMPPRMSRMRLLEDGGVATPHQQRGFDFASRLGLISSTPGAPIKSSRPGTGASFRDLFDKGSGVVSPPTPRSLKDLRDAAVTDVFSMSLSCLMAVVHPDWMSTVLGVLVSSRGRTVRLFSPSTLPLTFLDRSEMMRVFQAMGIGMVLFLKDVPLVRMDLEAPWSTVFWEDRRKVLVVLDQDVFDRWGCQVLDMCERLGAKISDVRPCFL